MSSILDNLPSVIPRQELKLDDVQSVQGDRESKPIIIAHSRPLEQGEKDLLRGYGTYLEWSSSYMNIPVQKLKFDYLTLDLHDKQARLLLMCNDLSSYHVVILCRRWEGLDDFVNDIQADNVVRSFPDKSPFKLNWDTLLLASKIHAPSCGKAVLRFLLNLVSGLEKK